MLKKMAVFWLLILTKTVDQYCKIGYNTHIRSNKQESKNGYT